MTPVDFPGAQVMEKPAEMTDEQCMSVPAMPVLVPFGDPIDSEQPYTRVWVEHWMPSKEDIDAIIAGRGIWIQLYCPQLIPVAMLTLDENGKSNDAG